MIWKSQPPTPVTCTTNNTAARTYPATAGAGVRNRIPPPFPPSRVATDHSAIQSDGGNGN
ncbi:hypothetical protein Aco03nite_017770 [Actinoplanes couchii]|uniref:Uncharacterized protein n=1 Tax=Actinoplanes couchii TaxID=403638 RepID=A0ABQ3X4P6_9ACTN|nr:hypothetical protein Aco03nite_017770 [Actinoplanes couchii]